MPTQVQYAAMNASPIKFGTSGWRGLIADDFTFATVRLAVNAIADHINAKTKNPTVLVGYDTRFYSEEFSQLAVEILLLGRRARSSRSHKRHRSPRGENNCKGPSPTLRAGRAFQLRQGRPRRNRESARGLSQAHRRTRALRRAAESQIQICRRRVAWVRRRLPRPRPLRSRRPGRGPAHEPRLPL